METEDFLTYVNAEPDEWNRQSPHTTLIVACYRVERYLPAFLRSLDAQTAAHTGYELVFVIDGCPEGSEQIVRDWMTGTDYPVRIISKPNGGVASARNAGVAVARGRWISSPDPDDTLDREYLSEIETARARFEGESMFVGRIRFLDETGADQVHPLDFKYGDGAIRLVDLTREPDSIQTLGGVVFFDGLEIRRHALSARTDLPTASDADFIMQYLLATRPRFVLVRSAEYRYQRRADGSSIVKSQESNIERNVIVFGVSHRALLDRAGAECPQWLANTLLYFAYYLFRRNRSDHSPVYATPTPVLAEIAREFRENLRRIGVERIMRFRMHDMHLDIRAAWLAAAAGSLHESPVELLSSATPGQARVAIYSSESEPPSGLRALEPDSRITAIKSRSIEYLEEEWVYQHIVIVQHAKERPIVLGCDSSFVLEFGGTAMTAERLREQQGLRKPRVPRRPGHRDPRSSGTSAPLQRVGLMSRLIHALHRARFSLPLRWYRRTHSPLATAGGIVFDLDGISASARSDLERLARETGHQAPVWCARAGTPSERRRLRSSGLRVIRAGSSRHFVAMKHARVLIVGNQRRAVPFPGDVLERSWSRILVLDAELGPHAYWSLNSADADGVLARTAAQERELIVDGGRYRFTSDDVRVLALGNAPGREASDHRAARWLQDAQGRE